jgi:thiamine biosynthesis lipoprotein
MTLTEDAIVHIEPVMGTVVSFRVFPGACSDADARAAVQSACLRLHELDRFFSIWNADSPMSLFRSGQLGLEEVPPEIPLVIELCRQARALSKGWFDPWAMPGGMDPTGLVKGWAVEQALAVLQAAGVEAAMVNGGGDIALLGCPPEGGAWRIGIRHPWRADALACVLEPNAAVATSGCYERGRHLLNPRSGRRPVSTASATITGASLSLVDALATALAVAGDEVLELVRSLDGYEAYLIRADGSEHATAGMVFARHGQDHNTSLTPGRPPGEMPSPGTRVRLRSFTVD